MLVNFVLVLTLLIAFCGLAIDVGMLELKKVQLQTAADAAVLGAVYQYESGDANWKSGGIADAGLNGFANGVNNVTVTITNPPTNGGFSGNNSAVQATVTQQVGTVFIGSSLKLSAQAVSLLPPCMMNLVSTSTGIDTLNSTGSNLTATCGVYVGRNIQEDSSSNLQTAGFYVVGPPASSSLNGSARPAPSFSSAIQKDPLAAIIQPTFSSCTHTGKNNSGVTETLQPGTYCGGSLSFSTSSIRLQPGLYIITGGLNWTDCVISGTGVTLFLTTGGGSGFGQFIVKHSTVSLYAPTSASQGSIPGVLLFTDRAWTGGAQDVQWTGGSTYGGDGIFYSINTGVEISGSNISGSNYLGFVVSNMSLSNAQLFAPYVNSPIASSGSVPASLVE